MMGGWVEYASTGFLLSFDFLNLISIGLALVSASGPRKRAFEPGLRYLCTMYVHTYLHTPKVM